MTQSQRLDAAARQKEVMQTHCPPVIKNIHMSLPHICHSAQVWNKLISSSRPDDKALNRHLIIFNEGTNQVMNHWKPSVSTCCRFAPSDVDAVPWSFCFRLSRTWSHWIEAAGKAGQHPTGVLCSIECECQCVHAWGFRMSRIRQMLQTHQNKPRTIMLLKICSF